jgi:hypothetical protein
MVAQQASHNRVIPFLALPETVQMAKEERLDAEICQNPNVLV